MCQALYTKWRESGLSLKLVVLIVLFASAAWIQVNGIWVELPLLVENSPQQWTLPSYLTVVIQLANIGPLIYLLLSKYVRIGGRNVVTEISATYFILIVGGVASFVLAFTWKHTSQINGEFYSTWLISLSFLLATVDCMSSVTFLPFMAYFPQKYMVIFYVGAGMSGFLPSVAALIQGVGEQTYTCDKVTKLKNISSMNETPFVDKVTEMNVTEIVPSFFERDPLFSVQIFFFFITAMIAISLTAFILLVRERKPNSSSPHFKKEGTEVEMCTKNDSKTEVHIEEEEKSKEHKDIYKSENSLLVNEDKGSMSMRTKWFILILNGVMNGFSNGVLPAIQSYACLPYGNNIYHLTLTLSSVINPVACFLYFFVSVKSTKIIFAGVLVYLASAGYVVGIATTSPCPLLNDSPVGGIIMLLVTVLGVGLVSYLRTAISTVLQQQGRKALLYCGISVQVGSLIAALTMFPMVSVYGKFKQSMPCHQCS